MTAPHYDERAIWHGDGGRPSAIGLLGGICFLSWSLLLGVLHIAGIVTWFG